jgi:type II secretory pathway component PulJ
MTKDDTLDIELKKLEKEIESKVDSLFVDSQMGEELESLDLEKEEEVYSKMLEEDEFRDLKEYFLTLEWEIDPKTLSKLSEEIQRLEKRFRENENVATLLGLMGKAVARIMEREDEGTKETISFLNNAKEALFQIIGKEEMILTPQELVREIESQYNDLIGPYEEEIKEGEALEEALSEVGFDEIEKVVERAIRPEGEPIEVKAWEAPSEVEKLVASKEEQITDLEYYKKRLLDQSDQLMSLIERFRLTEDLMGHKRLFDKMVEDLKALSKELLSIQEDLRVNAERLSLISFQQTKEAMEEKPPLKDLIFVSISNRIFAFPAESIEALFRVPMEYAPIVSKMSEIQLKDRVYPLVWLGEKVGMQKGITIFPKEERILLVRSAKGLKAIIVDKVIARQEVEVREIEEDQRKELFSGIAIIPKGAFIINSQFI